MILNIFVHEFQYNVGHSRAMIEVLNHLDETKIEAIKIICYEHDPIEEALPILASRTTVQRIPFKSIRPFLFKSLFFQFYTSLFFKKKNPKKEINITIGVCAFVGDVVNIQFAHYFWSDIYFNVTQNSLLKTVYKKLYFSYLDFCENTYYRKPELKFVFLSQFMQDSFLEKFNIEEKRSSLAYSSANLERFTPHKKEQSEIFKEILKEHSELSGLDLNKPTFLFVGAFERKGLPHLLDKIPNDSNFIIIGKPEKGSQIKIPRKENFYYVPYTNIVEKFYQCFDIFVFPTLFEPFGLVILEAAMCGMTVLVSKDKVGASELLENIEGINFIDPYKVPDLQKFSDKVNDSKRKSRYLERKQKLSHLTWKNCAKKWEETLSL